MAERPPNPSRRPSQEGGGPAWVLLALVLVALVALAGVGLALLAGWP